jgi:branched-chain amino acid transport system ATP-binding protein
VSCTDVDGRPARLVFGQLTVRENLVVAAYGAGLSLSSKELTRVEKRFDVLHRKSADKAGTMSGGEQQLLAIARALLQRPAFIVLDEPTLGLAPVMVDQLSQVLRDVLDDGVGILLMEQNRDLLADLCDDVHVMDQGRIINTLAAKSLYTSRLDEVYLGV